MCVTAMMVLLFGKLGALLIVPEKLSECGDVFRMRVFKLLRPTEDEWQQCIAARPRAVIALFHDRTTPKCV